MVRCTLPTPGRRGPAFSAKPAATNPGMRSCATPLLRRVACPRRGAGAPRPPRRPSCAASARRDPPAPLTNCPALAQSASRPPLAARGRPAGCRRTAGSSAAGSARSTPVRAGDAAHIGVDGSASIVAQTQVVEEALSERDHGVSPPVGKRKRPGRTLSVRGETLIYRKPSRTATINGRRRSTPRRKRPHDPEAGAPRPPRCGLVQRFFLTCSMMCLSNDFI